MRPGPLVEILVDALVLDGVALEGEPGDFVSAFEDALAGLVRERGWAPLLGPRPRPPAAVRERADGDHDLAARVAEAVWRQLPPPGGGNAEPTA